MQGTALCILMEAVSRKLLAHVPTAKCTKHLMHTCMLLLQLGALAALARDMHVERALNRWAGITLGGLVWEQAVGGVCTGGLPEGAPPSGARRAAAGHHRRAHRSGPTGNSSVLASSSSGKMLNFRKALWQVMLNAHVIVNIMQTTACSAGMPYSDMH